MSEPDKSIDEFNSNFVSPSSSIDKKNGSIDLLTGSPVFVKPTKIIKKAMKQKDKETSSDNIFVSAGNFSFSGRPLCFDDGRESLGILPQFKNQSGSVFLENPESFLCGEIRDFTGRPSLFDDVGRESLGILPQFKDNARQLFNVGSDDLLLVSIDEGNEESEMNKVIEEKQSSWSERFEKDCKAIESDTFIPGVEKDKDTTDENYSVYAEANFLASKLADNSILDISQEGTILDKTPQPDLIEEEDSISKPEVKVDTETIHKQLDIMVPPMQDKPTVVSSTEVTSNNEVQSQGDLSRKDVPIEINTTQSSQQILPEGTNNPYQTIPEIISLLSSIGNNVECNRIRQILKNATKDLAHLQEFNMTPNNDTKDDSGHSSAENDKPISAVLDLSLKSTNSTFGQALDLSFSKEDVPRRLSVTFSHNNDPALPDKQPSNNLKQQTIHMRPLWGSFGTSAHTSEGSSMFSNESRASASSTGSMKVKLKPKKSEPEILPRGPLKAVVPLTSLNTNLITEDVNKDNANRKKQIRTPKPVAQSTPEDVGLIRKKTVGPLESPLARPSRGTPLANRTRRIVELNRSQSMDMPKQENRAKYLTRGNSASSLKAADPLNAVIPTMRRAFSVGGKENLSSQKGFKQGQATSKINPTSMREPRTRLPQKNCGIKPFNLVEKLKKNKNT